MHGKNRWKNRPYFNGGSLRGGPSDFDNLRRAAGAWFFDEFEVTRPESGDIEPRGKAPNSG
jgi:hypothetical protein